jgi:Tfp pilus assembly protein PilP
MAMKLTTGILAVAMMSGALWGQNPDAIDNARSVAKSLQQKQTNDSNAALDAAGVPAPPAKPAPGAPAPAVKPAVLPSSQPVAPAVQPAAKPAAAAQKTAPSKPQAKPAKAAVTAKAAPKKDAAKPAAKQQVVKETKPVITPAAKPVAEPVKAAEPAQPKPEDKKWAMNGKRDPFFSPVVQASGSGCSTGKKCLEIGQINLRGVVKSDNGFIAVVTNNLNKAYFLRENDPVFNGYVVRITGDSVVFQETVQDKLGKAFTREVTKKIFTPAV